ncbi:MAG: sulfatase-like hydrolase/transferase [Verrucomicrobiota bacterium]
MTFRTPFRGFWIFFALYSSQFAFAADQVNFVLLMGDDHGWEETGYYDHPHVKTPVIDEMASRGLRFDYFYSAHSSCSPTRGSFLTGRHPNRYGTFNPGYSIRPEEITIAHLLKEEGYRCGHFGKWHIGPVKQSSPTSPGAMGFHDYVSHDNFFELDPPMSRQGGPPEIIKGESSAIVVDEALRFITKAASEESPFLAVLWFGSPHEPYSGLPEDLALYDDLPAELETREVSLTSNETGKRVKRPLRSVLRERYAEITAMDRAIGTLREALREKGLHENTLVWFCSDNGTPPSGVLASPFRGLKGQIFEGGIRVPGIIEWPAQIKEPRVTKMTAVTSDILPTLCDIVEIPVPDRPVDGVSLLPLIQGEVSERESPIGFWHFPRPTPDAKPYLDTELQKGTTPLVKESGGILTRNFRNFHHPVIRDHYYLGDRAWIDGHYKLIIRESEDGTARGSLYDLEADIDESEDIAAKHQARVESMASSLRSWQESVLQSLRGDDYP